MENFNEQFAVFGAAVQLHELYTSLVEAGFSEDQAMQIVCVMISAQQSGGIA